MTVHQLQTLIFTQPGVFSRSYKGPFKPNGQYFFVIFAAFRKDEAYRNYYFFVGVHSNIFIHQLSLKVSKYKVANIQEWYHNTICNILRSDYTSTDCSNTTVEEYE